ncbi:hypothetical protein DPV78_010555 [Talaromyces pinophilus]|nr:hypothetical protein DPV78_010555 [Talaromyces pinophilus]
MKYSGHWNVESFRTTSSSSKSRFKPRLKIHKCLNVRLTSEKGLPCLINCWSWGTNKLVSPVIHDEVAITIQLNTAREGLDDQFNAILSGL